MMLDGRMSFKKISFPLHTVRQMFNCSKKIRKFLRKISVSGSPTLGFFCEICEIFMSGFFAEHLQAPSFVKLDFPFYYKTLNNTKVKDDFSFLLLPNHNKEKVCRKQADIKEVNDFNFETEVHATLLKKETLAPVFNCEFCNIFKNNFFTEQLRATASNCIEK